MHHALSIHADTDYVQFLPSLPSQFQYIYSYVIKL